DGKVEPDGQHDRRALRAHGDAPAGQQGPCGGRIRRLRLVLRGALRPGERDMESGGRHELRARVPHGDAAAEWQGPGGGGANDQPLMGLSSVDLYEPVTGTWSQADYMFSAHMDH